ncbi:MAG: DUF11 domain-containing protein [Oscillospiraceae bacterium]|nr:DUF11 domain-containing protein [Oscillospiraceae bacterium]
MATFTNKATLSYNGGSVDSNTVTGELLEVLSITKTAILDEYTTGDTVTYVVALRNTGPTALTGLTVTDTLGGYSVGTDTLYPLTYVANSITYYVNGVLQPAPTVTAGPPLSVTGLSVPAGGNALLIYETTVNNYAPLAEGSTITNTATASGGGISTPVSATETITVGQRAMLTISKSLSPTVVTENGQLTYTFIIENTGNTPAAATDNIVVTDTFDPILNPIAVTFNGIAWTEGVNYTYNAATGEFSTTAGEITVPAATYTQNPDGTWTISPGVSTLTVTGTV